MSPPGAAPTSILIGLVGNAWVWPGAVAASSPARANAIEDDVNVRREIGVMTAALHLTEAPVHEPALA